MTPDNLEQQAIASALTQNWNDAVKINLEIIKKDQKSIEAQNRLGRAYMELGKNILAKKSFEKVLKIDPYNHIAHKNLVNCSSGKIIKNNGSRVLDPNLFLEDPGKTRTTTLVEVANKDVIFSSSIGDEITLSPRKRAIVVTTLNGTYLGKLADDLCQRLSAFMRSGNKYKVSIKSTEPGEIKIFIREISRSKKFADYPTFPPQEIAYLAFVPPDLVHDNRPEIADAEGEEKPEEETEKTDDETPDRDLDE